MTSPSAPPSPQAAPSSQETVCVRVTGLRKAITWQKPGDHPLVSTRASEPGRGFIPTNPNTPLGEISVEPGDVLISARDSLIITEVIPKRVFHREWLEISMPEDPKQGAIANNVLARLLAHNALKGSIDRLQGLDAESKKYMQDQLMMCIKSAFYAGAYNQSFADSSPAPALAPQSQSLPPPPLRVLGTTS